MTESESTRPAIPDPLPDALTVAIDTEFHGPTTLTVQTALRHPAGGVVARLYHDPSVPPPPAERELGATVAPPESPLIARCGALDCAGAGPITADLSPARMVRDLLNLPGAEPLTRAAFERRAAAEVPPFDNATWSARKNRWAVPTVHLTLVCHFQRADFARTFGTAFFGTLLRPEPPARPVALTGRKVLQFDQPVVEYLVIGTRAYALSVTFRDTNELFGPGSLDALAKAFVGTGKAGDFTPEERADMAAAFRARAPEAYAYAATDAVVTLLLYERMREADASVSAALGHPARQGGTVRSTLGGRVSDLIVCDARHRANGARPPPQDALTRTELVDSGSCSERCQLAPESGGS